MNALPPLERLEQRKIAIAVMGTTEIGVIECAADGDDIARDLVVTEIELDLFEGALDEERRDGVKDRPQSRPGDAGRHAHQGRLENPRVEIASRTGLRERLHDPVADISDNDDQLVVFTPDG